MDVYRVWSVDGVCAHGDIFCGGVTGDTVLIEAFFTCLALGVCLAIGKGKGLWLRTATAEEEPAQDKKGQTQEGRDWV